MRETKLIASGVAQANTGQTTVVDTPDWANYATYYLNVVTTAGTTPLTDYVIYHAVPKITAAAVVATSSAGGTTANEVQTIDLGDFATGDTTDFTYGGVETTTALAFDTLDAGATAAAREAIVLGILEDITALDGNISVTEDTENLVYAVEFINDLAARDVGDITITSASGFTPVGVTETTKGAGAERQSITLTGGPTHGTWTITWTGVSANITATTPALPANATADQVSQGLADALYATQGSYSPDTAYDGRDIAVTRSGAGTSADPYVYSLVFSGPTVTELDVDAVTVNGTALHTFTADTAHGIGNAWNGITQIVATTAGSVRVRVGPDLPATEDDTGPVYNIADVLPSRLAHVLTFDRGSSNETYSYSLYGDYAS